MGMLLLFLLLQNRIGRIFFAARISRRVEVGKGEILTGGKGALAKLYFFKNTSFSMYI